MKVDKQIAKEFYSIAEYLYKEQETFFNDSAFNVSEQSHKEQRLLFNHPTSNFLLDCRISFTAIANKAKQGIWSPRHVSEFKKSAKKTCRLLDGIMISKYFNKDKEEEFLEIKKKIVALEVMADLLKEA